MEEASRAKLRADAAPLQRAISDEPVAEFPAYTPNEMRADAIIHGMGIGLGFVGVLCLTLTARPESTGRLAALVVYQAALVAMLLCSAAYNLLPAGPRKRLLRRLDHAAIYLMIAGTYTPFAQRLIEQGSGPALLISVWALAGVGLSIKLSGMRFSEPWSTLSYLLFGWIVLLGIRPLAAAISSLALGLLVAGGVLYTAGVYFHMRARLPYHNPIWHGFVVAGAGCHFLAVWNEFA